MIRRVCLALDLKSTEDPSRGHFMMWSGLARSRFGRPQAVLESKCISHNV